MLGNQYQQTGGAPTASGSYNTGISLGPSLSQGQYQQALNRFRQIGQAPQSRPIGPAYGSYGNPQLNVGGMFNQARQALGTDAGNQASNAYSNMVNQGQADLAARQTGAQSQVGNAMGSALSSMYAGLLNRGSDINAAQLSNLGHRLGMGYDMAGNILGIGMNSINQLANPLMSGIFSGIGSLGGSLGSMLGGGGLGSLGGLGLGNFSSLGIGQQPLDLSGLGSMVSGDPLAALYAGATG